MALDLDTPDVTKYENKCVSSCLRSQEQAKREEGKGVRAKEMLRRCVKAERDPDSEKPREITRYICQCQWYDVSYSSYCFTVSNISIIYFLKAHCAIRF